MLDLGMVRPGETLDIPFSTYDSNDPSASVTCTGLAVTDIEILKDGSLTQRASDSGYAVDTDLDAVVGIHSIQIDLADNTTAGFFSAGSKYVVQVASITVDDATINFVAARFSIGYPDAIINTTIATLASQTSFTLTKGPAEADALNGMWVIIHDVASEVQLGYGVISDYAVTTKTVTLAAGTTFTAVATDNISIMGPAPLQPVVAAAALDVTATGAAGIDWGNVENKTTVNDLTQTDIQLVDTTTTNTDMVGTDSAALATALATAQLDLDTITGATGVNLLAASQASLDAIETDTNALNDTKIPDTISLAAINAEVDTALDTAISELGVAAPTATPTIRTGLMLLYMMARNRLDVQTSGTDAIEVYNNAGTKICAKLITDAAGDYSEAEMA